MALPPGLEVAVSSAVAPAVALAVALAVVPALALMLGLGCSSPFGTGGGSTGSTASDGGGDDGGPSGDGGDGGGWWTGDGGGSSTDGGGSSSTDGGWSTGTSGDADGDGYTIGDGDCDDGDRMVYPGADDSICDGQDNNCNGDIDEDFDRDSYEPNDSTATDLGKIPDETDQIMLAWLWPDTDEDHYTFYVEDGTFSWFDIELWLYDVPADADYALELWQIEDIDGDYVGLVDTADDLSDGGEELINYGGSYGFDDTGWYEAVVYSTNGAACDVPYTLQIVVGSWR